MQGDDSVDGGAEGLEEVDLDESMLSILGKALVAKLQATFTSEAVAIPFDPDPETRLDDGKRWWEVGGAWGAMGEGACACC